MDKIYTSKDLREILQTMIDYVQDLEVGEGDYYLYNLINTPLFHDAIGKVVEVTDNIEVIVRELWKRKII